MVCFMDFHGRKQQELAELQVPVARPQFISSLLSVIDQMAHEAAWQPGSGQLSMTLPIPSTN